MTILNICLIAVIIVLAMGIWFDNSPEGYEDEDSFHYGHKEDK